MICFQDVRLNNENKTTNYVIELENIVKDLIIITKNDKLNDYDTKSLIQRVLNKHTLYKGKIVSQYGEICETMYFTASNNKEATEFFDNKIDYFGILDHYLGNANIEEILREFDTVDYLFKEDLNDQQISLLKGLEDIIELNEVPTEDIENYVKKITNQPIHWILDKYNLNRTKEFLKLNVSKMGFNHLFDELKHNVIMGMYSDKNIDKFLDILKECCY